MRFNQKIKRVILVDLETNNFVEHGETGAKFLLKKGERYALPKDVGIAADADQDTKSRHLWAMAFNRGEVSGEYKPLPEPVVSNEKVLTQKDIDEAVKRAFEEGLKAREANTPDRPNNEPSEPVTNADRISSLVDGNSFKELKEYAEKLEINTKGMKSKKDLATAIAES